MWYPLLGGSEPWRKAKFAEYLTKRGREKRLIIIQGHIRVSAAEIEMRIHARTTVNVLDLVCFPLLT